MMWNGGYDAGWGTWLAMTLTMVVLVVLSIAAVILVVRALDNRGDAESRHGGRYWPGDEAQRLLDERLARGDMDEEQYRASRDLLSGRR